MRLKSKLKIVDQISVSSPCSDKAFETNADVLDRGWFCHQCNKEVYDLKKLSRKEIAKLVKKTEGHFCAVISRRLDGSMITKEPVSATHSFLSAGILLASTTLISSQAIAQTEAGGIAPLPVQDSQTERGDVYFKPKHCQAQLSETSSEASSMSEPSSVSSEPAASNITPDVVQSVGGVSVPEMRGEVTIPPKK